MNKKYPNPDWNPCTSQDVLIARAEMFAKIRNFFLQKKVLEVDTPSLSQGTITDVYLEPMSSSCHCIGNGEQPLYLQTSPEFAMKRLLAAGSGSIYQICRAFRGRKSLSTELPTMPARPQLDYVTTQVWRRRG